MTRVIDTIAGLRERLADAASVALVPTMGALHAGHLALVRRAAELADTVVVSIFVNPLQFGEGEDLDRYPRTLDEDLLLCAREGVDVVFAPALEEVPEAERATFQGIKRPDGKVATRNWIGHPRHRG